MGDDARIDLSTLDPSRDARRWEALVQQTLAAATPPEPLWLSVRHYRLPALAAAALALLAWAPTLLTEPSRAPQDPAVALLQHYASEGDVTALLESTDGW
jgi:anti-sigma-K factor RskA